MAEENKNLEAVELTDEEVETVTGGLFGEGAGSGAVGGVGTAFGQNTVASALSASGTTQSYIAEAARGDAARTNRKVSGFASLFRKIAAFFDGR